MSKLVKSWAMAVLLAALCASILWALLRHEKQVVETQIRGNLVAGTLLTRIQLAGERMRRFEKEMFIYASVADRRADYVKSFDDAYRAMLVDLDAALAPSGLAFSSDEREEMLRWKQAAVTYVAAFDALHDAARLLDRPDSAAGAQLRSTQDFNKAIEDGKNAFRVLLNGAETMRTRKKVDAAAIAGEIDRSLTVIALAAAGLCALAGAAVVVLLRRREAPPRAEAASAAARLRARSQLA